MKYPVLMAAAAVAALTGLVAGSAQTAPQAASAARVEIPIKEVDLPNGDRRYMVPIMVGATRIEAGLDTGSSGLRILPGVLTASDATETRSASVYGYGSGTELRGVIGKATVAMGALSAPTTVQMIHTVGCMSQKPDCPAKKVSLAEFGIQGDGLPGQGFKAILGVNMAEAEIATPLKAIGAKRWIVDLPRPGDTGPGRLILNPTDDEVNDYVRAPILTRFADQKGGFHDSVQGCILNMATQAKACGAAMLDTGAPGLQVVNGGMGQRPWPADTRGTLAFYDKTGQIAALTQFSVGLRTHASNLIFRDDSRANVTQIYSGLMGYFAFSVLYDPAAGELGFKGRPGGPQGLVAAVRKPGETAPH